MKLCWLQYWWYREKKVYFVLIRVKRQNEEVISMKNEKKKNHKTKKPKAHTQHHQPHISALSLKGTLKPEAKILTQNTLVELISCWWLEMWLQQPCRKKRTVTALLSSLSLHINRMGRAYLSNSEQEENKRQNFMSSWTGTTVIIYIVLIVPVVLAYWDIF